MSNKDNRQQQPAAKEGEAVLKDELTAEQLAAQEAAKQPGEEKPAQDSQGLESDYVPPAVDQVDGTTTEQPKEDPVAPEEPAAEPGPAVTAEATSAEASLEQVPEKVKAAEMVTGNGTAVTNIMVQRIEKHLKHLRGELGFADRAAQHAEQINFMETVGSSTGLAYPQFKLVTDTLVRAIADNKQLFRNGEAFRYTRGLANTGYPQASINRYEAYISFLTKIAVNWTTRHRLKSSTDIGIVIQDMKRVGKENVTMYFNDITSGK